MTRINTTFDGLQVIRFLQAFGNVTVTLRNPRPLELGQLGLVLRRPHISPYQASVFARGVSRDPYLVFESVLLRLVGHVDAGAIHVEFPSVVNASQAALFIAAPEKARSPVGTELINQSHMPVRGPEGNQVFSQEPHPDRGTVWSWHLRGQQRGYPKPAEVFSCGSSRIGLSESFIFFF